MLSKKQAKTFFLGGTIFFVAIFGYLSFDSLFRGIPEQTNIDQMSDSAKRGRLIWDEQNCMGCHTLMGEGAYYAPELTKVYERRGEEYIKMVFNFEGGWGPRGRRMIQYDLTEQEKQDMVEFFKWVGEMDLNGFPADPPLKQ